MDTSDEFESVRGFASSIDSAAKSVTVKKTDAAISYHLLIIASGGTTASSIGKGSSIGVKFAGELGDALKGKEGSKVTLLTQAQHLLPTLKEKVDIAAENFLRRISRGVDFAKGAKSRAG